MIHCFFSSSFRDFHFVGIGCLLLISSVVGTLYLLPESAQSDFQNVRSEKSKHLEDPFGYPHEFAKHFAAIQGLDQGYAPYPHGSKIVEFQKALRESAKRNSSVDLSWVERGPGRVGGRTRAVVLDPTDPEHNTWYAATVGGGVWRGRRSIDQYGTEQVEWSPLTDDLPSLAATALDISQSNPDILYLGTGEGFFSIDAASGVGMFKSTDRGETWSLLPPTAKSPNQDWRYINRLVVHPDNPDIVVAVTNTGIFRTEDGGQTFSKVYTASSRVQDLRVNPDNFSVQFASVNGTGILRSSDGGKTWTESFTNFVYAPARIELAISPSDPNVVWASAEGTGGRSIEEDPVSDLYRTTDGGQTWRFIDRSQSTAPEFSAFLGSQGWYDNALLVHPFSPDTVYVGGIIVSKAWVDGASQVTETTIGLVSSFNNSAGYLDFINFRADAAGGTLSLGYANEDEGDNVEDIDVSQMTSIEVRFGSGLVQKAHRFTVPPNGGANGDGGAGIPFTEYLYQDYVEVPFQVWDTENNRQLMVSFRDQASDGEWSLIPENTSGPGNTHSREYVFVSRYDYNDSTPKPEIAEDGGFRKGLMYFYWPFLNQGDEAPDWNPNSPAPGKITINFKKEKILREEYMMDLWVGGGEAHVDHHALISVPLDRSKNDFYVMNGNDGGIAYSRNGGDTWHEADASAGFNTSQFYDATKRPGFNTYLGGTQDNGTWASYNNANSRRGWRYMLGGDGFDVIWKGDGDQDADSLMGSIQFNNVWRSLDSGVNWEPAGNIPDWDGQFLSTLSWTPKSGDVVFSLSPSGGPLRSLDFGATWEAVHRNWQAAVGSNGKIRVSLADPSVVWAGYWFTQENFNGNLLVTENGLAPTDQVSFRRAVAPSYAPSIRISGLATHPWARSTAYVMFSAWCFPKLLRTENMGRTWEDLSGGFAGLGDCESDNGFPNSQVYDLAVFPDLPQVIWVGTDIGIFESRDHGETWAYADNGLPAVSVWRIRIVDGEVVLATHGRGVWTLDITEVQTAVKQDVAEIPNTFELEGNYPNPFNPSTNITFKVAENSDVRVTVFDLLGRKVATLTDQPYVRGTHQIQWDASSVSSGQYIYRMEANGKLIGAKSMVLLK